MAGRIIFFIFLQLPSTFAPPVMCKWGLGEAEQTEPGVPFSASAALPAPALPWGHPEMICPWMSPGLQGVPGWTLNQPRTSGREVGTENRAWAASSGKGHSQDCK